MGSKLTQSKKCSKACRVFDNTAKKKITAFNHSYVVLWYLHSMIHNLVSTYFLLVSLSGRGHFSFPWNILCWFSLRWHSVFLSASQLFHSKAHNTVDGKLAYCEKMLLFTNKILVLLLIYNFFILSSDLVSLNTICGLDFFRCLQILESHLQKKKNCTRSKL